MGRTPCQLSKSRVLSGHQCELRSWFEHNPPRFELDDDPVAEHVMATGRAVGELARRRYPGGVLIDADIESAISATAEQMSRGGATIIYEGAFRHDGVVVRTDILLRDCDERWQLIEVKSGTRSKAVHDIDLAVQIFVLQGAGVDLAAAAVLTLDRDYLWPGDALDLQLLFKLHDRFDDACALVDEVAQDVARLKTVIGSRRAPEVEPGPQCTSPYTCPWLELCNRDQVTSEWPLTDLPALGAKRRNALEEMGIDDIRDIPEDFQLGRLQSVARDAVLAEEEVVHGDLRGALAEVRHPVYSLDFECLSPAIPRFAGTRAYDQVPFQFSLHVEHADGRLEHREYLHRDAGDPRPMLAAQLVDMLGEHGSIVVYSGFEKSMMSSLASALPQHATSLERAVERLWDLHAVIRGSYYHPQFRGSFSIKRVLPVLVPELGYDDLAISDGALASVRYEHALEMEDAHEREQLFDALRAYCARDTLALVRLRAELAERLRRLNDC